MSTNRAGNKELRKLLRAIERAGGAVVFSRRHWKVYLDGVLIVTISASCSDRRAHFSVLADLRRAGLDVEVPR